MKPADDPTPDRDTIRDALYVRFVRKVLTGNRTITVTDDEVAYFRAYPDEIDDFSAPLAIHRVFLFTGVGLGLGMALVARVVGATEVLSALSPLVEGIIVDLTFGVGVALISASITAYMLGTLMNQQQRNAHAWRAELHARIEATEAAEQGRAGETPEAG